MLIPKSSGGGQKEIPEEGMHKAVLVKVVDFGTQPSFNAEYKPSRKLMLTFELIETSHVFNEENGPQPFIVSAEYTMSLNEKSNLFKALKTWNKAAVEKMISSDAAGLDIEAFLGRPAIVNIEHTTGKSNGINYANIGQKGAMIMPRAKNDKDNPIWKKPTSNPVTLFSLEPFVEDKFNALHQWEQDKIKKSLEWTDINAELNGSPRAAVGQDLSEEDIEIEF